MRVTPDIHVYHHFPDGLPDPAGIPLILAALTRMENKMSAISDAVTALQGQVSAETSVEQSAVTLLNGIPTLITNAINAANGDAATAVTNLQALGTQISQSSSALATAVTANTPAA